MKNHKLNIKIFCFIINIVPAFLFFLVQTQWLWIAVAIQLLILIYLLGSDFPLFAHSIFWPIFLASLLILPWPLAFIIPITIYLSIVLFSNKIKNELCWLKAGRINMTTIYLMVPVIVVSSSALILWVYLLKPDLTDLKSMVPSNSITVIIAAGLIFSIFNAAWEEIILKGILWDGLENIIGNILLVNLSQAVLFGIMHLNGFPRGIIGAILAGIYGLLIGFIRKNSGGLLAPVVTHFFADATIFGILVAIQ